MSNPHDKTEKLRTGYEGTNVPEDFSIPSCGFEDVDRAVFEHFSKKLKLTYASSRSPGVKPVPVLFGGGERISLSKRHLPVRDRNDTLILPLIVITRTSINQSEDLEGRGRGMGQDTGDLVITKKLSSSDRRYQNIVNELGLTNQANVAAGVSRSRELTIDGSPTATVETRRATGGGRNVTAMGSVLGREDFPCITEVITIPYPEFYTMYYEVIVWSQYQEEMNHILEQMISFYSAQGNSFRVDTDKGYWFVAFIDDEFSRDDNFDDYTSSERLIKWKFSIRVQGYLVAARHEGMPSPFRRFLSAPTLSFDVSTNRQVLDSERRFPEGVGTGDNDKFMLRDVTPMDRSADDLLGRNHVPEKYPELIEDPFAGGTKKRMVRVKTRYQRGGETVLSPDETFEID